MEKYTIHYNHEEEPPVTHDEFELEEDLDGFNFEPATDDEFSDILSYEPKEIPEDVSDEEMLDIYDEGIDTLFDALDAIQPHIEDDDTAEIWRELIRRARGSMNPDEGTSSAYLRDTLNKLQDCFVHLVNDVNHDKQNRV